MNTIAEIDVVIPLNYPDAESLREKTYTHQEVWKNVERILNEHYGTHYKLKL